MTGAVSIPRLRVCCYLSRIRTEQHFRQVLGRIIRRMGLHDADCYLFVLNEQLLRPYAHRIADDLPDENAIVTVIPPETAPLASGYGNTSPVAPFDTIFQPEENTSATEADMAEVAFGDSTSSAQATVTAASQWEHDVAFAQRFIEHLATLKLSS